jgi:hypothetical protein
MFIATGHALFVYKPGNRFITSIRTAHASRMLRRSAVFARPRVRPPTKTCGYVPTLAATSRPWGAMREAGPSIDITRNGGKSVTKAQAKKNVVSSIESVAKKLGNTRSVRRKYSVHPALRDLYMEGTLIQSLRTRLARRLSRSPHRLRPEEAAVIAVLQERLSTNNRDRSASGVTDRLWSTVPPYTVSPPYRGEKGHR